MVAAVVVGVHTRSPNSMIRITNQSQEDLPKSGDSLAENLLQSTHRLDRLGLTGWSKRCEEL